MPRTARLDDTTTRSLNAERNAADFGTDLAAIQSAVDDLPSGGGTVWVPRESGPYPADSDVLSIPDDVTIRSDGATISEGTKDVDGGDTLVIDNADTTNGNDNITIEGLRVQGKIEIKATGGTCTNIHLLDCECFDVPDFAFDLQDLRQFVVRDCETDNKGAGTGDNGNDGIHLTDCQDGAVDNWRANSGDDVLAIESIGAVSENIHVSGVRGSSGTGDLLKFYTNPSSGAGDDIRNITVDGPRSTAIDDGDGVEFENDGSGLIYDVTINGLHLSDPNGTGLQRGIVVDGSPDSGTALTNVTDITFNSPHIEDVQQQIAELGEGWEVYGGRLTNGGLEGSNYNAVVLNGDDCKLIGGQVGPTTQHCVVVSASECTVADVTVDATGSSNLGIRVNGEGARIRGNTIDAANSFAIGSSGTDNRAIITDNRTPSNNIGGDQFSAGAMYDNNIAPVTQDLSAHSNANKRDGQVYRHDGSNSISADGGTTSAEGLYAWSATDTEYKAVVAY